MAHAIEVNRKIEKIARNTIICYHQTKKNRTIKCHYWFLKKNETPYIYRLRIESKSHDNQLSWGCGCGLNRTSTPCLLILYMGSRLIYCSFSSSIFLCFQKWENDFISSIFSCPKAREIGNTLRWMNIALPLDKEVFVLTDSCESSIIFGTRSSLMVCFSNCDTYEQSLVIMFIWDELVFWSSIADWRTSNTYRNFDTISGLLMYFRLFDRQWVHQWKIENLCINLVKRT